MEWRRDASIGSMKERGLVETGMRNCGYAKGFSVVSKLRTRAFRFAPWLANVSYLPAGYQEKCPSCGERVIESNVHFMLDCNAYQEERRLIEPLLRELEEVGSDLSKKFQCDLLLGGAPGDPPAVLGASCIAGWCCNVFSCSSWSHHCFVCTTCGESPWQSCISDTICQFSSYASNDKPAIRYASFVLPYNEWHCL